MKKFSPFQQQAVAEPLLCLWQTSSCRAFSTAVYSRAECDVIACGQAGACHESAHQAHTALPASLDSFPCWRELDENPIFTNSYFLVEVDKAPGPLNHSFLIKGQPLRQEQHCLKWIFFLILSPQAPWKNIVLFYQHLHANSRFVFSDPSWTVSPSRRKFLIMNSEAEHLQKLALSKSTAKSCASLEKNCSNRSFATLSSYYQIEENEQNCDWMCEVSLA